MVVSDSHHGLEWIPLHFRHHVHLYWPVIANLIALAPLNLSMILLHLVSSLRYAHYAKYLSIGEICSQRLQNNPLEYIFEYRTPQIVSLDNQKFHH